jgi:hypothetical protein
MSYHLCLQGSWPVHAEFTFLYFVAMRPKTRFPLARREQGVEGREIEQLIASFKPGRSCRALIACFGSQKKSYTMVVPAPPLIWITGKPI